MVHVMLDGGFAVSTVSTPRPYSMPPFRQALSDAEIALVASYIRSAWGNGAAAVSEIEVRRLR
jgi:mono/diheme cytochrome c family protein